MEISAQEEASLRCYRQFHALAQKSPMDRVSLFCPSCFYFVFRARTSISRSPEARSAYCGPGADSFCLLFEHFRERKVWRGREGERKRGLCLPERLIVFLNSRFSGPARWFAFDRDLGHRNREFFLRVRLGEIQWWLDLLPDFFYLIF